jgi:GT2 family glycosyltransferase
MQQKISMIVLAHAPRASVATLVDALSATLDSLKNQGLDCWSAQVVVCAHHAASLRRAIGRGNHIKWHVLDSLDAYRLDIKTIFKKIRTEWVGWMYAGDLVRPDFLYWVLKPIMTSQQDLQLVTFDHQMGSDAREIKHQSWSNDLPKQRVSPDLQWESGYLDGNFIVRKDFAVKQLARFSFKRGAPLHSAPLNIVRAFANRLVAPLAKQKLATMRHVSQTLLFRKSACPIRARLQDSDQSRKEVVQDLSQLLKTLDPGVRVSTSNQQKNWLQIDWPLSKPTPCVHIVIPTRDRLDLLKPCIKSLLHQTEYPNYQVIVIDNGSIEPETLRYLKGLPKHAAIRNIELSVMRDDGPFNFSALNNKAVRHIQTGVLVFLNNDIKIIDRYLLREMVSHAMRPDVGCVGAKLLYPDGTIQHLGVTLGATHIASHLYATQHPKHWPSHNPILTCSSNPIAVTAAAMVIRAEVFHQLGGFNEDQLAVAYNDVDLCLRAEESGLRTVCTARAKLIHQESMSRKHTKPSEIKRERQESSWMRKRWSSQLALYHGNQSL